MQGESSQAIAAIYDAVLEEASFDAALDRICAATGADGFNIFLLNKKTGEVPVNLARGIPDEVLRDYNAHYVMVDPGIQFFIRNPNLPFYYNALHTAEDEIDRSEYYSWLQAHGGTRYYLAQTLQIDRDISMIATAQRGRRIGHAQPADMEILGQIGPHIQRAMRLKLLVGDLRDRLFASERALDEVPQGIVILSAAGRVIFANLRARHLTQGRDPLWIALGRLVALSRDSQSRLDAAIGSAASAGASPGTRRFGTVRLDRPEGRAVLAHVLSLGERLRASLIGAPSVLVLIHDPETDVAPDAAPLALLFDLTPVESAIAARLAAGVSPAEICRERGISANTLKTHRRRLYDKMGVNSQAELAHLVAGLKA
jgi:DNA-binding CsgD family transcriptional regulator/PAS domain-containing protein